MLSLAVCVLFLGLAHAQSVIDPNNCFIRTAAHGETVLCPGGYFLTGLCASGAGPECNGQYTNIKCCPLLGVSCTGGEMESFDEFNGVQFNCSPGGAMIGACTSGSDKGDCGVIASTRIVCLHNPELTEPKFCRWQYATFGYMVECGHDEVATAACSSLTNYDCSGYSHGLECCRVSHAPQE